MLSRCALTATHPSGVLQDCKGMLMLKPGDTVAVNMQAIALLHSGRVADAVGALETCIQSPEHQQAFLDEAVIGNLGALLELSNVGQSREAQKRIAASLVKVVPDDFDMAVLAM